MRKLFAFTLLVIMITYSSCVNEIDWAKEVSNGSVEIAANTATCMVGKELTWSNFGICAFNSVKDYLVKRLSANQSSKIPSDDEIATLVDNFTKSGRGVNDLPSDYQALFAEYLKRFKK